MDLEWWKTGWERLHFMPAGSWKEFKDGKDNQTMLPWCLLSKKSTPTPSEMLSWRNLQNTNGDMKDGPIIPVHAVMKAELTKCKLIVGGTRSANRVCRSNPARYGKCIHLCRGDDWQLAQVPYGLRRLQQHKNNTAGALIKASSYFHHRASKTSAQQLCPRERWHSRPGFLHISTMKLHVRVYMLAKEHMHNTDFLSFHRQPGLGSVFDGGCR